MRKFISLLAILIIFQSCLLIGKGGKDTLVLVDAPKDTKVKINNKSLEIKNVLAITDRHREFETNYLYPGVRFKMKKNSKLKISSNNIEKRAIIKHKYAIGILIFEGILTVGIGTIIDLATGSHIYPKERYIDVPAFLNDTKPRTQAELMIEVRKQIFESNR